MTNIPWTSEEVLKELAKRRLWEFVKQAWPIIEPQPLVEGWHLKAVCDHLQAVSEGKIRNLIINIPPRHTKSLIASVLWTAWEWGPYGKPRTRWLCTSYSGELSRRDSVKCRTLLQSPWYRARWGNRFTLMGDVNACERYANTKGGQRVSSSIGGLATGEGGDRIVVDDPHNVKDVTSKATRDEAIYWWDTVMSTRLNDPKKSSRVLIGQRSHNEDLFGHIQESSPKDYVWLVLPEEFEPQRRCQTPVRVISEDGELRNFADPRKQEGELLWPQRFGPDEVARFKFSTYVWAGQFQQRPAPLEGGILKRHWWSFYGPGCAQLPETFDLVFQSWDMAFKDTKTSDYVCGQVWGVKGANRYFLDETYERLDFVKTLTAVRRTTFKWPDAVAKLVEDKANGPAVISSLRSEIPGLISFTPVGSKESRAFAISPEVEAGNVYLPHPNICPWINDWIETVALFPSTAHDDRVDAFTQAMLWARRKAPQLNMPDIVSATKTSAWAQRWDVR